MDLKKLNSDITTFSMKFCYESGVAPTVYFSISASGPETRYRAGTGTCSRTIPGLERTVKSESFDMYTPRKPWAGRLLQKFKGGNELGRNQSVVSSPLSAEILLALIALGATEPARSELMKALVLRDDDFIRSSFTTVSKTFKSIKGVTLNVANKIYVKEGPYDLAPKIKNDAVDVFDADFEQVDFRDGAGAATLINKWVESKTNEGIKDLFNSGSFDDDTRLVLVNALYFKGNWKEKFPVSATRDHPFHTSPDNTVNVPMMNMKRTFRYGIDRELDVELLEMPYVGDEASMLIILPNKIDGLPDVLKKLADGYDLVSAVVEKRSRDVRVTIPRFKIETTIDLKELLPKLGINAIFDPQNSGLNHMLNIPEKIYISRAVQKAFIEVNEEGAEAAAATGLTFKLCCAPPQFVADHPFLYVLFGADHIPLFVGAYFGPDSA